MDAQRRMLWTKISVSEDVASLSPSAMLLFTWLLAHADGQGHFSANAQTVKTIVVPYLPWSVKKVGRMIDEIAQQNLIVRWTDEKSGRPVLAFPTWESYQEMRGSAWIGTRFPMPMALIEDLESQGLKCDLRRRNRSYKPVVDSGNNDIDDNGSNDGTSTNDAGITSEWNEGKSDGELTESIKSDNASIFSLKPSPLNLDTPKIDANANGALGVEERVRNFQPQNGVQAALYRAWKALEPNHPTVFERVYLYYERRGITEDVVQQFLSEVKQDATIDSPVKVFITKCRTWVDEHGKTESS